MKVQIVKTGLYGAANLSAGDVVDLDDALARRVFARGDGVAASRPAGPAPTPRPAASTPTPARRPAAGS